MAKFDGKFFKGSAGPIVYRKYRGEQIVQSQPNFSTGSQTKATKQAASNFGTASNLAKSLRTNLESIVTDYYDGTMSFRFTKEVNYSLSQSKSAQTNTYQFDTDSFDRLNGFEFNVKSMLRDNFFVQPERSLNNNLLEINLPEMNIPQDLKFPKNATKCLLSFTVGQYDLTYGHCHLSPIQSMEIDYSYSPRILLPQQFDFEIEPGCLCITVISLQYLRQTFAGYMFMNTKDFNPVAILSAFIAEGDVNEEKTKNWSKIDFKTNVSA